MRILLKAARRHIIHVNVMNIHMEAKVPFAAHLHDIPRPFWIAAMVLAFIWHWPIGLAVLAYLIGSGRLRRWSCQPGRWYNTANPNGQGFGWGPGGRFGGPFGVWGGGGPNVPPSSSNHAFDEYRAETLRRLEEEQREFMEYLDRLRQARDKQEFDQFMADRRHGAPPPQRPPQQPAN